jgi:hypothetical protein
MTGEPVPEFKTWMTRCSPCCAAGGRNLKAFLSSNQAALERHDASRLNYRCEPHFEALYDWLRNQGVTARKPLHELRKELGAILASEQGIFAAQSVLRHAQIFTTAAYYTDKKCRITAGLGSLLAPACPEVIVGSFTPGDAEFGDRKAPAGA